MAGCCPHSSGVGYVAVGTALTPHLMPYNNGSAELRARLATAAKRAYNTITRTPSAQSMRARPLVLLWQSHTASQVSTLKVASCGLIDPTRQPEETADPTS